MENTRRNIFTNKVIIHLNIYSELVKDERFFLVLVFSKRGYNEQKNVGGL